MTTIEALLSEIDTFLKDAGMAETTFGRRAVNDGKFVGRMRNGSGITVGMVDRVRAFICAQREELGLPKRRKAA